jgi:uncharacterized membrane protein YdfJ with MMPL/SSD domain
VSRLARWCARRRLVVVGAWLFILIGLGGAALSAGASFTNSTTMPDSESATAYSLLDTLGNGNATSRRSTGAAYERAYLVIGPPDISDLPQKPKDTPA